MAFAQRHRNLIFTAFPDADVAYDIYNVLSQLDVVVLNENIDRINSTPGAVDSSHFVMPDSNLDVSGFRNVGLTGSLTVGSTTLSGTELGLIDGLTTGTLVADKAVTVNINGRVDTLAVVTPVIGTSTAPGVAATCSSLAFIKTGIADNVATGIVRFTVGNAIINTGVRITLVAFPGAGTDANESTRIATGTLALARTAGANLVAALSTLEGAQIATVSGGGTITLAYSLSAVSGAAGATNTVDLQVTIVVTGSVTSHSCAYLVEAIHGVTHSSWGMASL